MSAQLLRNIGAGLPAVVLALVAAVYGCSSGSDDDTGSVAAAPDAGTVDAGGPADAGKSAPKDAGSDTKEESATPKCLVPGTQDMVDVTGTYAFPVANRDESCNTIYGQVTVTCEVTQKGCDAIAECTGNGQPATLAGLLELLSDKSYGAVGTMVVQGISIAYDIRFACSDKAAPCAVTDVVDVKLDSFLTCQMNGTKQ